MLPSPSPFTLHPSPFTLHPSLFIPSPFSLFSSVHLISPRLKVSKSAHTTCLSKTTKNEWTSGFGFSTCCLTSEIFRIQAFVNRWSASPEVHEDHVYTKDGNPSP